MSDLPVPVRIAISWIVGVIGFALGWAATWYAVGYLGPGCSPRDTVCDAPAMLGFLITVVIGSLVGLAFGSACGIYTRLRLDERDPRGAPTE